VLAELKRILLVEDDPNDVELTLTAFGNHRIANEIVVARDGVEALDCLYGRGAFAGRGAESPAFILLDLKMPRLDGLEVLRIVKADERLKQIPVVMLTSSREERDVIESYRLGVNAYVVKPVDFSAFTAAIRDIGAFWAVLNHPPPNP
jgi:CheY-like chemotaxis protein